jgi:hypothetical protein
MLSAESNTKASISVLLWLTPKINAPPFGMRFFPCTSNLLYDRRVCQLTYGSKNEYQKSGSCIFLAIYYEKIR